MRTNYHTHTERCGHAIGSDEAYVQNAIQGGFNLLGFADHTPWPFSDGYTSQIRMQMWELDGYVQSIRTLRERYKASIEIKIGLECEFYTDHIEWLKEQKERLELDYLLFGNHFPYREQCSLYFGNCYEKEDLNLYLKSSIEAMESGLYDCIAHPDLFIRSYPCIDDHCITIFRELATAAKDLDVVMEFNTTVPYHQELWEVVAEVNPKVIVGLDTHNRKLLKSTSTYDDACQLLQYLGINRIEKL